MLNKRQIAKKRNDIRYRDELVRRDQIRQAHYLKLREQRVEEQKVEPAEPVVEVDTIDEVKQEIQADEAVEVKPVAEVKPAVIKRVVPTRRKKAKGPRIPAESVPLKESDAEPLYFTRLRKKGWYDVFGPEGQVTITAKRLKAAEEMAERMNNGLSS